ncbi:MAG: DUF6188 family protein [Planctomycetota bacterium]
MNLFREQQITRVSFDFSISFTFDHGAELFVENNLDVLDGDRINQIKTADFTSFAGLIVGLLNRTVSFATTSDEGVLMLKFDSQLTIEVKPSEAFEAWSYNENGSRKIVCMPGGGLAIWS